MHLLTLFRIRPSRCSKPMPRLKLKKLILAFSLLAAHSYADTPAWQAYTQAQTTAWADFVRQATSVARVPVLKPAVGVPDLKPAVSDVKVVAPASRPHAVKKRLNPATAPLTDVNIANAVVGEAEQCTYQAMLGVADAIRNRRTFCGVYGFQSPQTARAPRWVWLRAQQATKESRTVDIVADARFFGNAHDVAKGTFRGLRFVCRLGKPGYYVYFYT